VAPLLCFARITSRVSEKNGDVYDRRIRVMWNEKDGEQEKEYGLDRKQKFI
jgi:hypothetical protein